MGSTTKLDFTKFWNVINGELTTTPETRHGINPANGHQNPPVPLSRPEDLDKAVAAAKAAQKSWAKTTIEEREKCLIDYTKELETHVEEFATLLTAEQGKPTFLAQDEVKRTVALIKTIASLRINEELLEDLEDKTATVRYMPIGVCCGLVPWNYPLALQWVKIASAVITGNTIIVKPSPETPYCGLKSVELATQFFPKGVVQVLSGGPELGIWCTSHPGIDKISFTGSVATGKKVMESCGKTLKRVTLELGGNDAAIVCEDADIALAVPPIAQLAFINSGQICMAVKRIYVHSSIYDAFLEALVAFAKNFKVGPATDPSNFIGPLQSAAQHSRVLSYFEEIKKEGLHAVMGGSNDALKDQEGFFITPTVIDNPPDSARIVKEEQFGPILPVLKWDCSDEEIIDRVNDTEMGLGASVWSKDLVRAEKMARQLQAGSVWVNMHFEGSARVPYGGVKSSGLGSECGVIGLKNWCDVQAVWAPKPKV